MRMHGLLIGLVSIHIESSKVLILFMDKKLTLKNVSPAAHLGEKSPPGKRRERKVGMFSNVF